MSATTEFLILQAAPAPMGPSALGAPVSEADYKAFSETLKAELNSGQKATENGKSLPQGGENLPDHQATAAQQSEAVPASEQQETAISAKDTQSPGTAAGTSETGAATHSDLTEAGQDQSALRDSSLQAMTDAADQRDVMPGQTSAALALDAESALTGEPSAITGEPSAAKIDTHAISEAPGQWTRAEISERLDAIWHLLASSGEGTLPGKIETDLHQKLAHSQHPLAAIEQRLGQLAGAGVFEFTEAVYRDGTRANALTALTTSLASDAATPSAMADSTRVVMNADNTLNTQNISGGAVTPAQSQRLDAIWNMMASSGQGGIQGAIAADLHQALAYSDDSLDSIQLRLQTLASEGTTHFNKSNYFADQSLSERLITTQEVRGGGVALARANQTVAGSPDATIPRADTLAAARTGADSVRMNAASSARAIGTDSDPLAGVEVDPRRAAMAFASTQNKPTATRAEAASPNTTARAANLSANDLQQAVSAPRVSESRAAERAAGITALDRNTAVTLSPAQMAEQRRTGQSVATGSANQGGATAPNLKISDAGRTLMSASVSADLTTNMDGPDGLQAVNVARVRMTAALDARPAVSSSAATLDPMSMAQGAMQDARLEGRLAQDLGGNRAVSFELPQATNTTAPTTASTVTGAPAPSGLSASVPTASSAAIRPGGEHVMQNVPSAPQFSDEVGEQVRVFVNNGLQEARLQLTPADLGRVQITINTEGDNARVVFVAETAAARDLLDQSMPRLREMLQQSGIQLAQGDVSDQTESQRRGEQLGADAERVAHADEATDTEQVVRPELGGIDGIDSVDGSGRVDTYI